MSNKLLHPFHLSADYTLANLQPGVGIEIDSPATALMLDFRSHPVLTLPPDTLLEEAQHTVRNSHSSAVLAVDRFDRLCGVITRGALSAQSIMKKVGQGRRREELQAGDFMLPRELLTAVNLTEIENASLGKVITLLRHEGVSTVLVVDNGSREVVGLLCAGEIEQILGLKLNLPYNPSFLEIFDAVMH